jgi:chemotaxis signal transduction protein
LRKRLGVAGPAPTHPSILILRDVGPDRITAILVDLVLKVVQIPSEGILAPPPRVFGIRAEYIRGVGNAGGHPMVWLDAAKLLASSESIVLLT